MELNAGITLYDLDRLIRNADLVPPDTQLPPGGHLESRPRPPDIRKALRVSTAADDSEHNADSPELWSPDNPFLRRPNSRADVGTSALVRLRKTSEDRGYAAPSPAAARPLVLWNGGKHSRCRISNGRRNPSGPSSDPLIASVGVLDGKRPFLEHLPVPDLPFPRVGRHLEVLREF